MKKNTTSKLVAIFVVLLFFGMIFSSMFSGGQRKIILDDLKLLDDNEQDHKKLLWLRIINRGENPKNITVTIKLRGEVINSSKVTIPPSPAKQLVYDFTYRSPADMLVVQLKDENGKIFREISASVMNYPGFGKQP